MKRKQTAWARFLALLDKWFPREKPRKRICGTCGKQIKSGERWHTERREVILGRETVHHDRCKAPAKKRTRVVRVEPDAEESVSEGLKRLGVQ